MQIEGYWASLDLPRLVYSPLAHSHLKQQPPNSQTAKVAFPPAERSANAALSIANTKPHTWHTHAPHTRTK